ncbi:MAG: PQQ-binding-like beta-propeller repeat protein [Chitinivibrionales bacterium]|nr:PQQ-binding-like beta-propeller repeat protein [Chitinivibrionales bacterium]
MRVIYGLSASGAAGSFLTLAILVPALCFADDWPAFRGNMQRTGYYAAPVGYPGREPSWKKNLGCAFVSSPSIADGVLYIGGRDSCLYALDAATGHLLWKRKTRGWVDSSPLVHDGKVFAGSRDGTVYVFDVAGKDAGALIAGLQLSSPGLMKDGVLVSGLGPPYRGVSGYAWDQPKWQKVPWLWSVGFGQMSYSSPAIRGQAVVIGASDGKLYGVDAGGGKAMWELKTGGGVYLSTPAVENMTAYFAPGNYDRNVYAVGLLDGKVRWQASGSAGTTLAKRLQSNPVPPAQLMELMRYSPAYRLKVVKRLARQGSGLPERSRQRLARSLRKRGGLSGEWSPTGGMKTSSVAVGPDNVYVIQKALGLQQMYTANGLELNYLPEFTLIALDKHTGAEAWPPVSELRNCVRLGYCSSPVVTKHSVFFGWGEGRVYAVDRTTGETVWRDTLSGDVISSPAIADKSLFYATMAGTIYCYPLDSTAAGISFKHGTYCYPNPAPGRCRELVSNIQVFVDRPARMSMTIYSMADKPVLRVHKDMAALEKYRYRWDIGNVANGVYFARIKVEYSDEKGGEEKKTVKIAILK